MAYGVQRGRVGRFFLGAGVLVWVFECLGLSPGCFVITSEPV